MGWFFLHFGDVTACESDLIWLLLWGSGNGEALWSSGHVASPTGCRYQMVEECRRHQKRVRVCDVTWQSAMASDSMCVAHVADRLHNDTESASPSGECLSQPQPQPTGRPVPRAVVEGWVDGRPALGHSLGTSGWVITNIGWGN